MCAPVNLVQTSAACLSSRAPDFKVNIVYEMNVRSVGDICEEDLEAQPESFAMHCNPMAAPKRTPAARWQHLVLRLRRGRPWSVGRLATSAGLRYMDR